MSTRLAAMGLLGCITTLAAVQCFAAAAADAPKVFSPMTWPEAKKEAAKDGGEPRMVLLDFTAVWCGPCKQMEKTTWLDERVEKWVTDNKAIAIQVDVDKDRDTAGEFRISAMPTMVLVRGDTTLDRAVGFRSADQLLAWLDNAKGGKREIDAVKQEAAAGGGTDVDARYKLARSLVQEGELAKATDEYLWLFDNMVKYKPEMVGVRNSFLISDIRRLCEQHDPARVRFVARRDALGERLKGEKKSWDDLNDWIVLNDAVKEDAKTLEWFDRIKDQPDSGPTIKRFHFRLERLLIENARWADAGRIIRDPRQKVRQDAMLLEMDGRGLGEMPEDRRAEMREIHERMFREGSARLYASLLAAGREDDARATAEEALKVLGDDMTRVAFIDVALEANQGRPEHLRWLDAMKTEGVDKESLRKKVERSIEDQSRRG